ncbi:hypothetical protein GOZ97_07990 [Agrobacterium vitis]|nr:hypothetical protein [Allorhizobium ampelinum]MUO89928.1 hypothetical protein [Agrobacterium vitis]MUZ53135.1 hypothetical protein [Agrobacterium vitis]MUZ91354.1 hypothetical protein [Agrobacterium vitis]MVA40202.1 hypothetical protein [Agrobacterium vitis]
MIEKFIFLTFVMTSVLMSSGASRAENCPAAISETDVLQAEERWGKGLVEIGAAEDAKTAAKKFIADTYGYQEGTVLFKPTKASVVEFRDTPEDALSYFVTGRLAEDHGFALTPYTNVRFENHAIIYDCKTAISMGNYYFTAKDGSVTKADYTMGFIKTADGHLKINIQHSSLPYTPSH